MVAIQSVSVCAAPRVQGPAPARPSLQTPQADPRLRRSIQCAFHEERLDIVLQELTHKAGVPLTLTPDLAPRRLTGRITGKPAVSFMLAMGRVPHISWRKSGDRYELFQTPEQRETEKLLKRRSEERENAFLRGQAEQLRDQVSRAAIFPEKRRGVMLNLFPNSEGSLRLKEIEAERGMPTSYFGTGSSRNLGSPSITICSRRRVVVPSFAWNTARNCTGSCFAARGKRVAMIRTLPGKF